MPTLLFVGAPMNQGRAEQTDAHTGERHSGARARQLLLIDDVLQNAGAATAILLGPANSDPLSFVEFLMPLDAGFPCAVAFLRENITRWWRVLDILLEPAAQFFAEAFVLGAIVEIHLRCLPR